RRADSGACAPRRRRDLRPPGARRHLRARHRAPRPHPRLEPVPLLSVQGGALRRGPGAWARPGAGARGLRARSGSGPARDHAGGGELFDVVLGNLSFVQLGYRTALENPARFGAERRIADRWLGLLEGVLRPAQVRGEIKGIDPVLFMVTIDALVHWHIVNDGLYRQLLGRGLDDPDVARRVREHLTTVALRTLGLE